MLQIIQRENALVVRGELTVEHAHEIRDALLDAFNGLDSVVLDVSGVEDVDLAGMQVLCSACKSAVKLGKGLAYEGRPPALVDAAETFGRCLEATRDYHGGRCFTGFGG